MPFDSYAALQTSILNWIGRPDDPLVAPAVPDFIALFEAEARDRLRTRFAEQLNVELWGDAGVYPLPCDFAAVRRVLYDTRGLRFRPAFELDDWEWPGTPAGRPLWYTIEGLELRISPPPDTDLPLVIDYMQGLPALSARIASNWLLDTAPDLYLYGSLAGAEGYIGNDERVAGWIQMREAAFERVRRADLAATWGGAPLRVRVDGDTP
jgi:hypothetical protein